MNVIWQCDGRNKTVYEAVNEFCDTYWDKPRKAGPLGEDEKFSIRDGVAIYQCWWMDHSNCWSIVKL